MHQISHQVLMQGNADALFNYRSVEVHCRGIVRRLCTDMLMLSALFCRCAAIVQRPGKPKAPPATSLVPKSWIEGLGVSPQPHISTPHAGSLHPQ